MWGIRWNNSSRKHRVDQLWEEGEEENEKGGLERGAKWWSVRKGRVAEDSPLQLVVVSSRLYSN